MPSTRFEISNLKMTYINGMANYIKNASITFYRVFLEISSLMMQA
jgi:hypothetical protein